MGKRSVSDSLKWKGETEPLKPSIPFQVLFEKIRQDARKKAIANSTVQQSGTEKQIVCYPDCNTK
jgi:hypothetical protein